MATIVENQTQKEKPLAWEKPTRGKERLMFVAGRRRRVRVRVEQWHENVRQRSWEGRPAHQYRITEHSVAALPVRLSLGFHAELLQWHEDALAAVGFINDGERYLFDTFGEAAAACAADAARRFGTARSPFPTGDGRHEP